MIVIDTNIISEIMRPQPDDSVITWLDQQDTSTLYVTTISIAEIRYGLEILPEGGRKQRMTHQFNAYIKHAFEARVLDFTLDAANQYAAFMAYRRKVGLPMSMADGQIAAIASVYHFAVATRNTKDFAECGLTLMNPFIAMTDT